MPLSPSGEGRLMDVHVQDAFCSPFRVWSATLPTLQSWGQIVEFVGGLFQRMAIAIYVVGRCSSRSESGTTLEQFG